MDRTELEQLLREAFKAGMEYDAWAEGYAMPAEPPDEDEYVRKVLNDQTD